MTQRHTVCNLRRINLDDYEDPNLTVEDLSDSLVKSLYSLGEAKLIDPDSGDLRPDWFKIIHDFIENDI